MTGETEKNKRPKGSVGSSVRNRRPSARKRVSETRESGTKLVSSRTKLGPSRAERRGESRAVQIVLWLSLLFFLIISGGLFTYQSYAFLSGDKQDTSVPDIAQMNYEEAAVLVEEAGLVLRIRSEAYSDDVEKDLIIEQIPASSARVKEGREVLVDVSLGSRTLTTPNVIGLDRVEAEQILADVGVVPNFRNQYSEIAAAGTVINQSPPSGASIALGENVNIVLSAGPLDRAEDMPDLTGLPYEEAERILSEQRLALRRVSRTYLAGIEEEVVMDQYPLAGTQVRSGSEVLLTLKSPTYRERLGQRSARIVVNVPESAGMVRVQITVQDRYETKEVYNEERTGPSMIEQLISSYGRTTVRVNFNSRNIREEIY